MLLLVPYSFLLQILSQGDLRAIEHKDLLRRDCKSDEQEEVGSMELKVALVRSFQKYHLKDLKLAFARLVRLGKESIQKVYQKYHLKDCMQVLAKQELEFEELILDLLKCQICHQWQALQELLFIQQEEQLFIMFILEVHHLRHLVQLQLNLNSLQVYFHFL